jgi:DNA-binding MarR family transcriptional regulator
MTDRKQQIEQLMEKLHSLKRLMTPDSLAAGGEDCLAHSQWLALHLVSRQEGIGIKELAAALSITSSAATQLVDGLVNKGFLNRQPSLEDRRALHLSLPEESRQKIDAIKVQRLERLCAIFGALDDAEFQTLLDLIDKVISRNQIEKR